MEDSRREKTPAEVLEDRAKRLKLIQMYLLPAFTKAERSAPFSREIWTREILQSIWPDVMGGAAEDLDLTLVIDGLDEMKMDDQKAFFDCLEKLDTIASRDRKIRILIVSGDDEMTDPRAMTDFDTYTVTQSDTMTDIRKTVDEGLERIWRSRKCQDEALRQRISDTIVNDSNGNYLWATMAVEHLRRSPEINEAALEEGSLPRDVGKLYDGILEKILGRRNSASFAALALQWSLFQEGKLKAAEFNTAQAVAMAREKKASKGNPNNDLSHEDLDEFLTGNIKAKVNFSCGQLVNLRDERLELVHSSLGTHLAARAGKLGEQQGHRDLANTCMAYLTMPQFRNPEVSDRKQEWADEWESKVRRRIRKHGFLRYAARYWYQHLHAAGPSFQRSDPKVTQILDKLDPRPMPDGKADSKPHAMSWSEAWWFLTKGLTKEYPQDCPAHEIVASEGISRSHNYQLPETTNLVSDLGDFTTHKSALHGYAASTHTTDKVAASNMPSHTIHGQYESSRPSWEADQSRKHRRSMDELSTRQSVDQGQDEKTPQNKEERGRTVYRVISADPITKEVLVPGPPVVFDRFKFIERPRPPPRPYFKRVGNAIMQVGM